MAEKTIWGIHAGKSGDAETLFLKKNYVAIGWSNMGDLSVYKPTRDAFKAGYIKPDFGGGKSRVAFLCEYWATRPLQRGCES